jgi:gentisate 1,2-dioxygenase
MSHAIQEQTVASQPCFVERDSYYLQAQPPFDAHAFLDERAVAFDPGAPTGFTTLDYSAALGCSWPATTPVMLARYGRLRSGESLESRFGAGGEVYYVMQGSGTSENRDARIEWQQGDVFCFAGGCSTRHAAGAEGALLWVVTDEPLQAYLGVHSPQACPNVPPALHYRAASIAEALAAAQRVEEKKGSASNGNAAFIFSSEAGKARRLLPFPALMLALNSLVPGSAQRPHRHNSAALTLVLEGEGCHSMIDGARYDWQPFAAIVTPPGHLHSHHNRSAQVARVLIVQDSGVHYYLRSAGFSYD